jgi:hypothetical protein
MKLRPRSEGQAELRRVSIFLRAAVRALTVVGLPILVLAPFAARGAASPHQPAPPAVVVSVPPRPSQLLAGTTLRSGEFLASSGGRYRLDMQANGNLVLSWEGHVLWASRTSGHPGAVATMQRDGNFVIYQRRRAIWSSRTSRDPKGSYHLSLQTDGNVVLYSPAHRSIWETHTSIARVRAVPSVHRPQDR